MDERHRIGGTDFVWSTERAASTWRRRGIRFEDAASVFMDPLLVLADASRNDEARDAVIGFDQRAGCGSWCISSLKAIASASSPPALPSPTRRPFMLNETLKERLAKDRPVTSITLRIPVDVVDSLKAIAPHKGYSGYQTLLKAYISEGLRRDEAIHTSDTVERLSRALKKHGVSDKVLDAALREAAG